MLTINFLIAFTKLVRNLLRYPKGINKVASTEKRMQVVGLHFEVINILTTVRN